MCIYCNNCVYHYKSTELLSLYTLDIGLKINIIIISAVRMGSMGGRGTLAGAGSSVVARTTGIIVDETLVGYEG